MKFKTQYLDDELTLDGYISIDGDQVSAAIFKTVLPGDEGDFIFGAYYGYAGGGENDGGFFSIDIENSITKHIDFSEFDEMQEDNRKHHSILEALMQKLWHYVDEDEGVMELSANAHELQFDGDGFWLSNGFDGDMLSEISDMWLISLKFED